MALTADAWDAQMLFLGAHGCRVVAHDRRGHGRSEQTWDGNTMDQYADDLAELIDSLDLKDAVLTGHSTGGGEVRYIGRHGTARVAKAVLISAVPPIMIKTDANPGGLPIGVFDGLRAGVHDDRSNFYQGLAMPFFGYNRPDATPSQGVIDSFWLQGMLGGIRRAYECVKQFSEPSEDRRADIGPSRRLRRRAARPLRHGRRPSQRRSAGLHRERLSFQLRGLGAPGPNQGCSSLTRGAHPDRPSGRFRFKRAATHPGGAFGARKRLEGVAIQARPPKKEGQS